MAAIGPTPGDEGLSALFDSSPDLGVHTSAAAEGGFVLGIFALLAAPFSIMHAVALGVGALAGVLAFAGMVATSRPTVAGGALVPAGLAFSFMAVALVGLRYLGLDTAFGDEFLPTLGEWLRTLNSEFPRP